MSDKQPVINLNESIRNRALELLVFRRNVDDMMVQFLNRSYVAGTDPKDGVQRVLSAAMVEIAMTPIKQEVRETTETAQPENIIPMTGEGGE